MPATVEHMEQFEFESRALKGHQEMYLCIGNERLHLLFGRAIHKANVGLLCGECLQLLRRVQPCNDERQVGQLRRDTGDDMHGCLVVLGYTEVAMVEDIVAPVGRALGSVLGVERGYINHRRSGEHLPEMGFVLMRYGKDSVGGKQVLPFVTLQFACLYGEEDLLPQRRGGFAKGTVVVVLDVAFPKEPCARAQGWVRKELAADQSLKQDRVVVLQQMRQQRLRRSAHNSIGQGGEVLPKGGATRVVEDLMAQAFQGRFMVKSTLVVAVENDTDSRFVQCANLIENINRPAVVGRVRYIETDYVQIAGHKDWKRCRNCSA